MADLVRYVWLLPIGVLVGIFGTLIGAGGGFLLAPLLLLMYPHESPEILTSISLAVVFFNAFSGSVAYARMRRIDYFSGTIFALATVPGAVVGALTTTYIPRRVFDLIFGSCMILVALFLLMRPHRYAGSRQPAPHQIQRTLVDATGTPYTYAYNPVLGVTLSTVVGYLSSLLGIGGGIIHVPAMVNLLHFPVHIATATSHFALAVMALAGTIVHIATGTFHHGVRRTIVLALGVLVGAQLGARLSHAVQGVWILRGLAAALGAVGVRILLQALAHT
jgi:uncharacterized membrane protein YfcA